jgi:hypothetical protein
MGTSKYSDASFTSEMFSEQMSDKIGCKQQCSTYPSFRHIRLDFIYVKTECVRIFLWNRGFGSLNAGFRNRQQSRYKKAAVITDYTAVLLKVVQKTAVNRSFSNDTAVLL